MKISLQKGNSDVILVVKRDKTEFIEKGILEYLCSEEVKGGKKIEMGWVIPVSSTVQNIPQYEIYNHFMYTAQGHGYSSVFFNN